MDLPRRLRWAEPSSVNAIDQLWVPAWEGGHQDHDVANFLGAQFRDRRQVLEFPEYNFARGVRTKEFPFTTGHETVLSLSPEEVSWKRGLVDRYRSERANLAHVGYAREVIRPLALYDDTSPRTPACCSTSGSTGCRPDTRASTSPRPPTSAGP